MLKPVRQKLFAALLMFLMTWNIAVANNYEVTLASQSQSKEEWQNLVKEGLAQVIERASNEASIQGNPQLKRALENATDFVEQYAYEGNRLTVKYSADLINELIHKMGHIVLKQKRSNVVLWLAIEEQHQRRLVGIESDPALQSYLTRLASQKGIALVLPLMDLEDMTAVTVTDVWGQFPTVLQQASMRYDAQSVLVGRIVHHEADEINSWEGNWELLNQNDIPAWKVEAKTLEDVLSRGLTTIAQHLKKDTQVTVKSVGGQQGKPFFIAIEDIQSSRDFHKVEAYLRSLDPILNMNVYQVLGTVAIFEITPRGENGRQILAQAINSDHQLIALDALQNSPEEMRYRWGEGTR